MEADQISKIFNYDIFRSEVKMSRFLRNNDDEVLEGNTYYWKWKITNPLPKRFLVAEKRFKLHSLTWIHSAWMRDGSLNTFLRGGTYSKDCLNSFFEIKVGIIGDDLKEIAAISSPVLRAPLYYLFEFTNTSQLHSILMTNKYLYLFVEIEKRDENGQKIKIRRQRIEADFKELLLSGRNSDVTIEVKRKKFNCHRCILGARSAVFAAMFDQDMKEKSSGVVTIEDVEPGVFKEFLLYLYSGNDSHLSWKNVAELYKLAHTYGMDDLKIACTKDINDNIREYKDNFVEFFKLSRLHNDSTLTEILIQAFWKMSPELVKIRHTDWATFLSENPVDVVITALPEDYKKKHNKEQIHTQQLSMN